VDDPRIYNRFHGAAPIHLPNTLVIATDSSALDRYLIESPHTAEDCKKVVKSVYTQHFLNNCDWGCMSGVPTSWVIIEAENEKEAMLVVPHVLRNNASDQARKVRAGNGQRLAGIAGRHPIEWGAGIPVITSLGERSTAVSPRAGESGPWSCDRTGSRVCGCNHRCTHTSRIGPQAFAITTRILQKNRASLDRNW
jgi:hypothetical protein